MHVDHTQILLNHTHLISAIIVMFDTIKKEFCWYWVCIGIIEYDIEYSSYAHAQFVVWVINLFIIIQQNKLEIIHEHNSVKTTTSGVTVQRNTMWHVMIVQIIVSCCGLKREWCPCFRASTCFFFQKLTAQLSRRVSQMLQ